jgi:hypothetical protein
VTVSSSLNKKIYISPDLHAARDFAAIAAESINMAEYTAQNFLHIACLAALALAGSGPLAIDGLTGRRATGAQSR